jgi:hypothetical protein
MTTTDQVLIIILCALLSIFFALCIAVMIGVLKLLGALRQIVDKAEEAVESVESAAEVLKNSTGKLAFFKLLNNLIKMSQGKKK